MSTSTDTKPCPSWPLLKWALLSSVLVAGCLTDLHFICSVGAGCKSPVLLNYVSRALTLSCSCSSYLSFGANYSYLVLTWINLCNINSLYTLYLCRLEIPWDHLVCLVHSLLNNDPHKMLYRMLENLGMYQHIEGYPRMQLYSWGQDTYKQDIWSSSYRR